jgi:tRNA A-37 threonylcarbamoyl transferase component Bud32
LRQQSDTLNSLLLPQRSIRFTIHSPSKAEPHNKEAAINPTTQKRFGIEITTPLAQAGHNGCATALQWHCSRAITAELQEWFDQHWPSALDNPEYLIKQDSKASVSICEGVVAKAYLYAPGIKGWIAGCLRSRAGRAFHMGTQLRKAGLPVPDMLALATLKTAGSVRQEYLLTREIPNACPFAIWLRSPDLTQAKLNPMLDQLGALLARFHQEGLSNRDLKGGNVLVTESSDSISLCVVDLDGIRQMRSPGVRRRRRDFWPILHSIALCGWDTPESRARLLSAYNAHSSRPLDVSQLPPIVRITDSSTPGWLRVARIISLSGLIKRTLYASFPADSPEWETRALRYWQGQLLHLDSVPSSPEAVVEVGPVDDSKKRYYFKRFLMRSGFDGLKHRVRASRARRTWKGNALAAQRGLHVAPVACCIEVREKMRVIGSVLVTEAVEETTPLRTLLADERLDMKTRRRLATQLGAEVARWHAASVVHGDMRHGNILCHDNGNTFTFTFVDNERTCLTHNLHERARNLVQLNMISPDRVPIRERLLLWRAYMRTAPGDRLYKRRLRAEVLAWTQRRWRKQGWRMDRK